MRGAERGVRALLFDKDGTIFGFAETWAAPIARMLLGLAGGDTARAQGMGAAIGFDPQGGAFVPNSPMVSGSVGEIAEQLHPFVDAMSRNALEKAIAAFSVDVVPRGTVGDLPALFALLKRRSYAVGLATNDSEEGAITQMRMAKILPYFDFLCGYDSGFGRKPEPGPLQAFSERVGVPPGCVAVIGDSAHDLEMARAGGAVALAVLSGPASRAALSPLADAVLPDIGALPAWLSHPAQGEKETVSV